MKIHSTNPTSPLSRAFLQVFTLVAEGQTEVASPDEADMLLVVGTDDIRSLYAKYGDTKFIAAIEVSRPLGQRPEQPPSIFVMDGTNLIRGDRGAPAMVERFNVWRDSRSAPPAPPVRPTIGPVAQLSRSYTVLIVDDSAKNLELAMRVLPGQKILLAQNMLDARRYYEMGGIEAVLTDLNMPPDKAYPAINLDRYGAAETVPVGISIMFEATAKGSPVAIVTDANHHQDWFSAMFDGVKGGTVNGQRVLFRGDSGKRWDHALKALVEPEPGS